ncbi:MAG: TetR/AcrR family transcriptional regulator [Bacteroidales bacterium]|jgi:AcrR family transcriptional regulator|nr:TetR/AcrR family transcriptional regulator [Bacteroidales bacterium]
MELRDRIINETISLASKKSCKDITMDEISQRLGISKRTLYEQFSDKSSLFENCLNYSFEFIKNDLNSIIEDANNSLISLIRIIQKAAISFPVRCDLIHDFEKYYPQVYNNTFVKQVNYIKVEILEKLVDRVVENGYFFKDSDFNLFHNIIQLNLLYATRSSYIEKNPKYTSEQLSNIHLLIIVRGFATQEGIKIIDKYKDTLKIISK